MPYRQGVYNEDGEPIGVETCYEPDPADMIDDHDEGLLQLEERMYERSLQPPEYDFLRDDVDMELT